MFYGELIFAVIIAGQYYDNLLFLVIKDVYALDTFELYTDNLHEKIFPLYLHI